MSHEIHLSGTRNDLEPRSEPYWGSPIGQGRYLGFRMNKSEVGTWIARLRDDDGKQRYRSLGQATKEFDHSQAKKKAEVWFKNKDAGISDEPPTITEACREYVTHLKADGRESTSKDADMRFRRCVYKHEIAKIKLNKLRTVALRDWRNQLRGSKSSQNRNLSILKAALNLAVTHERVDPTVSQKWRNVKPHKNADKSRDIYLDLKQRRTLLNACEGSIRDFVEAATLTGARPGELANARRSQFDARTRTMTFIGKTGTRKIQLSDAAVELFKQLAKSKTPKAHLFTRDDGLPWAHRKWAYPLKEAAEKAGLPEGVVTYSLRHSWISEALKMGMPTLEVARLTGTSLEMIEKHYGHLATKDVFDRLNKVAML